MLAIKWAIEKCDFYVRFSKEILVFCDNRNISDIFKMDLSDMENERLLKMREKLISYPIKVIHVAGKTHAIADKLSRFPNSATKCPDIDEKITPIVSS